MKQVERYKNGGPGKKESGFQHLHTYFCYVPHPMTYIFLCWRNKRIVFQAEIRIPDTKNHTALLTEYIAPVFPARRK